MTLQIIKMPPGAGGLQRVEARQEQMVTEQKVTGDESFFFFGGGLLWGQFEFDGFRS